MKTGARLAAVSLSLAVNLLVSAAAVGAAPTRASIEKELDRLGDQISRVNEEFNLARIQLSTTESKLGETAARKAEADQKLSSLRKAATARSVAVYRAGVPNIIMAVIGSSSFEELKRRIGIITLVSDWETSLIDSLELARQRSDFLAEELRAEADQRRRVAESIAAKKRDLDRKIAEQRSLLSRLDAAARVRITAPARRPPIDFASLPASPGARIAVQTAYDQIGKPYRYGASGPDSFDCSGLTMFSWGRAGISLPHSSRAQYGATKRVARESLQPGDLVFFGSPIHHVGIYIGNGSMINAPESGSTVGIRSIDRRDYAGAGRPGV